MSAASAGLRRDVKRLLRQIEGSFFDRKGPRSLTEMGEEIFAMIGAKEWAAQIAAAVQNAVAGMEPFEIHEYCLDYTRRILDLTAEQGGKIGAAAYEYGVSRDEVLGVLAIVLRDILLERNGHPVPKRKTDSESE